MSFLQLRYSLIMTKRPFFNVISPLEQLVGFGAARHVTKSVCLRYLPFLVDLMQKEERFAERRSRTGHLSSRRKRSMQCFHTASKRIANYNIYISLSGQTNTDNLIKKFSYSLSGNGALVILLGF